MTSWRIAGRTRGRLLRTLAVVAAAVLVAASSSREQPRISPVPAVKGQSAKNASHQAEATTPTATLGVYYFGGWSGSLGNEHFEGLPNGPYQDHQPLYGWLDDSKQTMRTQLYWASKIGIRFFDFLWYYNAENIPDDPYLNTALGNYQALKDHQGVDFAITYIAADPFVIPTAAWHDVVEGLVTKYFTDPNYMRIDGKPIFGWDTVGFFGQHGGDAGPHAASGDVAVNAALLELQTVAQEHGLPGVFVIGSEYVSDLYNWNYFPEPTRAENYDGLNEYAYPAAPGAVSGEREYSELVSAAERDWDLFAARTVHPYIPTVMVGSDPRPWNEYIEGKLFWYIRTPEEVASFVRDAVDWVGLHPAMRVEPAPAPPVVFLTTWNELGEGAYFVPTIGDRFAYGRAIASAVGLTWDPQPRLLEVTARGKGSLSVDGKRCRSGCSKKFAEGLIATIRARPAPGFSFSGWSGACEGARPRCSILMDTAKSVVAWFVRE